MKTITDTELQSNRETPGNGWLPCPVGRAETPGLADTSDRLRQRQLPAGWDSLHRANGAQAR